MQSSGSLVTQTGIPVTLGNKGMPRKVWQLMPNLVTSDPLVPVPEIHRIRPRRDKTVIEAGKIEEARPDTEADSRSRSRGRV